MGAETVEAVIMEAVMTEAVNMGAEMMQVVIMGVEHLASSTRIHPPKP